MSQVLNWPAALVLYSAAAFAPSVLPTRLAARTARTIPQAAAAGSDDDIWAARFSLEKAWEVPYPSPHAPPPRPTGAAAPRRTTHETKAPATAPSRRAPAAACARSRSWEKSQLGFLAAAADSARPGPGRAAGSAFEKLTETRRAGAGAASRAATRRAADSARTSAGPSTAVLSQVGAVRLDLTF